MYKVSESYKKAIEKLSRETMINGLLTLPDGTEINIQDKDIMAGTLNIDNACVNSSDFELGAVYVGQLKASINTEINRYKMYGATITLSYFIKLEDGTYEEIPLGTYTVDDAVRSGRYISLTSYDNMINFDKDFVITTNGTAYDLLKFACDYCGVEMAQTPEEILAMSPIYTDGTAVIFRIKDENSFSTFRDLISEVAMSLGGFATIDRAGKLVIKRFSNEKITINEKHRKKTSISDYIIKYSAVQTTINDKTYKTGTENYKTLKVESDLWDTGTDEVKQFIVDNIYNAIKDIEYTPTDIEYDGDPALDLGDKLEYIGGSVEEPTTTFIMTSNWTYKNTHKITAAGSNPLLATARTKSEKQIDKTQGAVKQNELKISTFQSATLFDIGEYDQLIVQMGINATSGAMVFQGQCIIDVTEPGTFEIVYELNGDQMLFKPRQVAPYKGYYLINLYYPLTTLSGDYTNNWNVYLKSIDGGKGTIDNGSIVANLIGSNLGAGRNPFTGVVDLVARFTMTKIAGMEKVKFKEKVEVEVIKPTLQPFNENYKMVGFGGIGMYQMDDNINIETI